jgi:hypothetical protein
MRLFLNNVDWFNYGAQILKYFAQNFVSAFYLYNTISSISIVSIVTFYGVDDLEDILQVPIGSRIFNFSMSYTPDMGSTKPMGSRGFFPRGKVTGL